MFHSKELEVLDLWISSMENVVDWESVWLTEGGDTECFYPITSGSVASDSGAVVSGAVASGATGSVTSAPIAPA